MLLEDGCVIECLFLLLCVLSIFHLDLSVIAARPHEVHTGGQPHTQVRTKVSASVRSPGKHYIQESTHAAC